MSKADKMFEELGYKKIKDSYGIDYKKDSLCISFNKHLKTYDAGFEYGSHYGIDKILNRAIQLKLKELGWLDE